MLYALFQYLLLLLLPLLLLLISVASERPPFPSTAP
jgi:hypothetical protein